MVAGNGRIGRVPANGEHGNVSGSKGIRDTYSEVRNTRGRAHRGLHYGFNVVGVGASTDGEIQCSGKAEPSRGRIDRYRGAGLRVGLAVRGGAENQEDQGFHGYDCIPALNGWVFIRPLPR